jgi:CubicO group peptidase (beta-lactamase class C family)
MASQVESTGIDELLRTAVTDGVAPGVVATAADAYGVIYEGAAGRRSADEDDPVGVDTLFRIASMTKALTSVAALQLVERGDLELDQPVGDVRPDFDELQVLEGFDGDTPRLRAPASRATVRQLLTHTSGLTYWIWNQDTSRYDDDTGTPNVVAGTLDAFGNPLGFDPGTRWEYGMNTDWLGQVVEAASGQALDAYVAEHIFAALGMTASTFAPTAEQRAHLTPVHARAGDGFAVTGLDWVEGPEFYAGGHAAYSTPRDYLRFQRALMAGGTLDGAQVLRPETVELMFANHIGDLHSVLLRTAHPDLSNDAEFFPGMEKKWGLGVELVTEDVPGGRRSGSGHWAGLFNTYFWIDRSTGIAGAIYTQLLPFADERVVGLLGDFERAVYAR